MASSSCSPTPGRVIALIDMDCFYAQVEQREKPELWGKPMGVAQYNQYRGGGLIAVSYEARAAGVKRCMRGDEAKAICPELVVCHVPLSKYSNDKADLSKYRDASAEVFKVLNDYDSEIVVERASIDEAFLDLTFVVERERIVADSVADLQVDLPTTHIADGNDKGDDYDRSSALRSWLTRSVQETSSNANDYDLRLALAARIVERIRAKILSETQFFCSAGISHNKMLAKLVCARHKPRQQTILPPAFQSKIYETTPISSVRKFGGKLGAIIKSCFGIETMGQLASANLDDLRAYGADAKTISLIKRMAAGIDHEGVKPRDLQLSIGVGKNFRGPTALRTVEDIQKRLKELLCELAARLTVDCQTNQRTATSLSVGVGLEGEGCISRHCSLPAIDADSMYREVWAAIRPLNKAPKQQPANMWHPPVLNISLSAGKFESGAGVKSKSVLDYFSRQDDTDNQASTSTAVAITDNDDKAIAKNENGTDGCGEDGDDDCSIISCTTSANHCNNDDDTVTVEVYEVEASAATRQARNLPCASTSPIHSALPAITENNSDSAMPGFSENSAEQLIIPVSSTPGTSSKRFGSDGVEIIPDNPLAVPSISSFHNKAASHSPSASALPRNAALPGLPAFPERLGQIPPEVLKQLPADIQLEIRHHYRLEEESVGVATNNSNNSNGLKRPGSKVGGGGANARGKPSPPKRPKRSSAHATTTKSHKLTDFFLMPNSTGR